MNRAMKIILVLVSMVLLCSCVPWRKKDDDGFYVKKTSDAGATNTLPQYILDISYEPEETNISEIQNVQFP